MRPTPDNKTPPCSVPSQFTFSRWGGSASNVISSFHGANNIDIEMSQVGADGAVSISDIGTNVKCHDLRVDQRIALVSIRW
jgi:hypothetical protein